MRSVLPILVIILGLCTLQAQEPDAWDFVPGEKIILYDDYTDMTRGGTPPHWKGRGAAVRLADSRLTAGGETRNLEL